MAGRVWCRDRSGHRAVRVWFGLILLAMISLSALYGCNPLYGFVESEFELAPDSRLPVWFTIPQNYDRKDLTMTFTYYTHPMFRKVKMIVRGPAPDHKILMKRIGTRRIHPFTWKQLNEGKKGDKYPDIYPLYSIITVGDIEEVTEQRRPEPKLYITDDPRLTGELKQRKTSN